MLRSVMMSALCLLGVGCNQTRNVDEVDQGPDPTASTGEPECATTEDCQVLLAMDIDGIPAFENSFHDRERVFCHSTPLGERFCSECAADSDCSVGFACSVPFFCFPLAACSSASDCLVEGDLWSSGCVNGYCRPCTMDAHCQDGSVCIEQGAWVAGRCISSSRVEAACVDGTCPWECTETIPSEDGDLVLTCTKEPTPEEGD
jgi:hypothetical protein